MIPDTDDAFVEDFESCRIANSTFRHADHIRLAWIYLCRHGYPEAEARMREGIRRLAVHAGAPGKYHETMTIAWMRLVAVGLALSPQAGTFADFSRAHAWLLDKNAVLAFWSRERLMGDTARAQWIDPDMKALPAV